MVDETRDVYDLLQPALQNGRLVRGAQKLLAAAGDSRP
jgi:hypothetical protein